MMEQRKAIIAMKGHPFTGKTMLANSLAKFLGCPVISLDEILLSLSLKNHGDEDLAPPEPSQSDAFIQSPSPEESDTLYNLAFDAISAIAVPQLAMGIHCNVIVDSPLSSPSQLDRLLRIARETSNRSPDLRLVIVECVSKNDYLWKKRFEDGYELQEHYNLWYKAKSWREVEGLREYEMDSLISEFSNHFMIAKLVLDPAVDVPFSDYLLNRIPPFCEAVEDLITRDIPYGEPPVISVEFDQWLQEIKSGYLQNAPVQDDDEMRSKPFCSNGHEVTIYAEQAEVEEEVHCEACQKQVTGAKYSCRFCSLALHKSCAERIKFRNFITPHELVCSTYIGEPYELQESHACRSCKEEGKDFSEECRSCIFESHLRHRSMPVVFRHVGHDNHWLTLQVLPRYDPDIHFLHCNACLGPLGSMSHMAVFYFCDSCQFRYHPACLLTPLEQRHEHGGYDHVMTLEFASEEMEDYLCGDCSEERDPKGWYYYCKSCVFVIHLHCMFRQIKERVRFAFPESLLEPSQEEQEEEH